MHRRTRHAICLLGLWLAGLTASGLALAQTDGQDLMLAGNEHFRAGSYASAVEAYEQARSAGFDTPLLQYNLGVAHYKLGNYLQAELALEQAAREPRLAALALYNLGLATLAAGWPEAAAGRFEQVIEISDDTALTSAAERALARTRQTEAAVARITSPDWTPYREPEPKIGELSFVVAARYGTDDNVYRTPPAPYLDLARPSQPIVIPNQQSASFMPVDLLTHYAIQAEPLQTQFNLVYRLNGDFYDSEFANANEVTQRFEVGADVDLEGRHLRTLNATFYGVIHDETNFDPDTGVDRDINGEDISDRFSYKGAGLKSRYGHELQRWYFGFDARIERRTYDDAPIVTRFDHEFFFLRLEADRQIGTDTILNFGVRSYRRAYDVRPARDSLGVLSSANPPLEYNYTAATVGVDRRLTSNLRLSAAVEQIERTDNFEGYADYSQSVFRFGLTYRPNRRTMIGMTALSRSYDYPNAFAFNLPIADPMAIDSQDLELDFEYRFRNSLSFWATFELYDQSSSDPRIAYARNRAVAGVMWRL